MADWDEPQGDTSTTNERAWMKRALDAESTIITLREYNARQAALIREIATERESAECERDDLRRMRDTLREDNARQAALIRELATERDRLHLAHASQVDQLDAAIKDRDAAERELERHRHGETIEGDGVCPNELEACNLRQERAAANESRYTWHRAACEAAEEYAAACAERDAAIARAEAAERERDAAVRLSEDGPYTVQQVWNAIGGVLGNETLWPLAKHAGWCEGQAREARAEVERLLALHEKRKEIAIRAAAERGRLRAEVERLMVFVHGVPARSKHRDSACTPASCAKCGAEEILRAIAAAPAASEPATPCPGPTCECCTGEHCDRHGKEPCDCDGADRHEPPTPRPVTVDIDDAEDAAIAASRRLSARPVTVEPVLSSIEHRDGSPVVDCARYLIVCAQGWDPGARLVGNIRADDVVRVAEAALAAEARPVVLPDLGPRRAHISPALLDLTSEEQRPVTVPVGFIERWACIWAFDYAHMKRQEGATYLVEKMLAEIGATERPEPSEAERIAAWVLDQTSSLSSRYYLTETASADLVAAIRSGAWRSTRPSEPTADDLERAQARLSAHLSDGWDSLIRAAIAAGMDPRRLA